MRLAAFLQTVYLPSRVEVSTTYAADLASVVKAFSAHLGRPALLDDLSEANLSCYLSAYRRNRSARSTNDKRQILLCLWRAAYDHMLIDRAPRPRLIRRLPEQLDSPEAWTMEQVGELVSIAAATPGNVAGIPAADWWASLILTVYWSGCRIGALLQTPSSSYRDGMLLVQNQKNRKAQLYSLPESCCELIDATDPASRKLLWPWPHDRRWFFRRMRRLVEAAGLPCPRTGRQLFHRLRRTNLSYCAAVDPAIAQRQAGHSNYATTLKHYVDPRIARGLTAADVLPDPLKAARPQLRIYG